MSQTEFLQRLSNLLKNIPEEEKQDILSDYEEHFRIAIESGRPEIQVAAELGKPEIIAKECITNFHLEKASENQSVSSLFRAIYTSVGLGFFNVIFLLGPFIAAVAVIFSLFVVSFAFLITPLAAIASAFTVDSISEFFLNLFISIGFAGLGLLIGVGGFKVSRAFIAWSTNYVKSNLNIIKEENKSI
ncbi:HAAS signaling domain-containing protein [Sporosarcina globispora]|uniref:HAAS signaling domain-containing protein n=1 Tax=Sporosarcina globispora TaxID=1459 RepID=UPI0006A99994|nr:DUF1700 domain-containing protein [Sporosarcina globispora]